MVDMSIAPINFHLHFMDHVLALFKVFLQRLNMQRVIQTFLEVQGACFLRLLVLSFMLIHFFLLVLLVAYWSILIHQRRALDIAVPRHSHWPSLRKTSATNFSLPLIPYLFLINQYLWPNTNILSSLDKRFILLILLLNNIKFVLQLHLACSISCFLGNTEVLIQDICFAFRVLIVDMVVGLDDLWDVRV